MCFPPCKFFLFTRFSNFLQCFFVALFFVSSKMAVLEIQGNGESSYVPQEAINNAIQSLEDPLQRVSDLCNTSFKVPFFI